MLGVARQHSACIPAHECSEGSERCWVTIFTLFPRTSALTGRWPLPGNITRAFQRVNAQKDLSVARFLGDTSHAVIKLHIEFYYTFTP
ncbi:hypothetical protein NDU88_011488 [Pleurodeles waltl]|uniref:Uncharacterized protein n=1 Tax=Pleurodeles waltl TaxID=8319 RepID=A0AAV7PXX2_PLEWA|nr:hypothetical protein NDU88_011488 [Pleurodeles waltl]